MIETHLPSSHKPGNHPHNLEDIYPLSPLQQGMLFQSLLHQDSGVYLMQDRYRIGGPLQVDAFLEAWRLVVAAHPALRTSFLWKTQKQPLQVVHKKVALPIEIIDLRDRTPAEQETYIQELLEAEQRSGFNLAKPPLIRFRLVRLDDDTHELIRSFHHILMDAWCISLVMMDCINAYDALRQGQRPVMRRPRPFREYIAWLQKQDRARAQAFWQQQLQGLDAPTPLVVETAPRQSQYREAVLVDDGLIRFDETQTQAITRFCQTHRITPNTLFQGAWGLLLARYSGNADVVFGVTVSGRPPELPGVEDMIGLFINTLPLRVRIDEDQAVAPWLQALQSLNLELREYEHSALVDIQGWSDFPRGEELFDSILVYENAPFDARLLDGDLSFRLENMEHSVHTHYGLTVVIMPWGSLAIRISYDRRRFSRDSIERLLGHLRQLVLGMVAEPNAPLRSLALLTDNERRQLLSDWNQTHHDFPLDKTYAQLFAEQVAAHPEKIAAVCQDESLPYAELDARASRLAAALIEAGAGPDCLVAVLAERGLGFLASVIAIFKAGAAYLPLEVNHPPQRLAEILTLSQSSLMLASEAQAALVNQLCPAVPQPPTLLTIETFWRGDGPVPAIELSGKPQDLVYAIFTSGSTGKPKGALVEQNGMLNNIFGKVPTLGLSAHDRIAQTASVAFDISVWQFLAAPLLGATVHILPDEISHDPEWLLAALEQQAVTVLEAVPAMIRGLLSVCKPQTRLKTLRWLLPTGEALPPVLCRDWFARFPHIPLMNAYGPAECSDDVAFHAITEAAKAAAQTMPIGRPTPNNQLFILDAALRPVPIGVPGEICVAGQGVGRGYLNDPERTRTAFVPHPFQPGARFYRTGDLGRYRSDGVLEFLGRRDSQVKVRGHRIELGEIEARLQQHPAVCDAAVIARPDVRGELQLAAYWVKQAESPIAINSEHLQAALGSQLPPYMVPALWIELDALPRNANGKTDRRQLARRELDWGTGAQARVAPGTGTEQTLYRIWAEILALDAFSIDTFSIKDSFFALGGHSLLATQVISRIRAAFQIELPLKTLFEHPTVQLLAEVIDVECQQQESSVKQDGSVKAGSVKTMGIRPSVRPERIPLSFAQQRLWFIEQLNPGTAHFNVPLALKLEGSVDPTALQQSFVLLIERHEVLRTAFVNENGQPYQQILDTVPFEMPVIRLPKEASSTITSITPELPHGFEQPFDLSRPPLLRARLIQLGEKEHILAVTLHHLVSDAWSATVALRELAQLYAALQAGQAPALPPLTIQYADFALWQREHLQGETLNRQLTYWKDTLAPADDDACDYLLNLPTDKPRPAIQSYRSNLCSTRLPIALSDRIRALADTQQQSPFSLILAAFAVLLHRMSGQNTLIVGTPVSDRNRIETESLLGILLNNLPIRVDFSEYSNECSTFARIARQVSNTLLDAQAHQDLPFEQLVDRLALPRSLSHAPLFQVMVAQQLPVEPGVRFPGVRFEVLETPLNHSEHDLDLHIVTSARGAIELELMYAADLFHPNTGVRLLAHFEHLLNAVVDTPNARIIDLPLDALPLAPLAPSRQHSNHKKNTHNPAPNGLAASMEPPQNPTEQRVTELWSQVLNLMPERISRHANFFQIGGHSLLATILLARLRQHFQPAPTLRQLFEYPTVASLANLIDSDRKRAREHQSPALRPLPRPSKLPLSHAQQRMWFLEQLDPDTAQYNVPSAFLFEGPLNTGWLRQSLERVIHRHEILRSRIQTQDGQTELVIDPARPFNLPVDSVEAEQDHAWRQVIRQAAGTEAARPFDLARDALVRARLIQRQDQQRQDQAQTLLLLTLHHCVADDWSLQIFTDELAEFYQAQARQRKPKLPALTIQYVDYSLWQRQAAQQALYQKQLDYWRQTLGGNDYVLNLPTDRPRSAWTDTAAGSRFLTLPDPLAAQLRQYAQCQGVTLYMVLLAALKLLLSRYSGQQDIRVGTPVANRPLAEVQPLIGCFINTLVIKSDVNPVLTFNQLLTAIKHQVLEAQEHQEVPFEQVVEALAQERHPERSPLFQVMFTHQTASVETKTWPGLKVQELPVAMAGAKFDLNVEVHDNQRDVSLLLEYRQALFDDATMARWLAQWQDLLIQIVADPQRKLAEYEGLTAGEKRLILQDWNQTRADFPLERTYAELFAAQVANSPDRIAAVCQGEHLTYAELNDRANRLAQALIDNGAGPDVIVALLAERGLPLLTMMIAVFKAGAAYLPLDVNHPLRRLTELLNLSGAPIVLAAEQAGSLLDTVLAAATTTPVCLIAESLWLCGEAIEPPQVGGPDDLAYVIFTSGSTGIPKGAMVEQRGMLNNSYGKVPAIGLCASDRLAQTAPVAFDISVWQFLAAPLLGATLHILPDAVTQDPQRLLEAIDREGITLLEVVPSMMRAMLTVCPPQITLASLRWLMSIGEALPPALCRRWFERFPEVPLMNLYGPAECADNIAFHPITQAPEEHCLHMPIGRPTANNQLFVLDSNLQPVPIGVPGEICTSGAGVGRGYLHDPQRTRQAFVPHPFCPGTRFYRTGDIGRYRADGVIEYLGRKDHQVKVRGQRIELGEIESRLAHHPVVAAVAVLALPDARGDTCLVAYWQAKPGSDTDTASLREDLARELPAFMVPTLLKRLDEMPLNANGKLDRKALAARPLDIDHDAGPDYVVPRTAIEAHLAVLWAEILDQPQIGVSDNFFALGGHSLLATVLLARLRQCYRVTPSLRELFEHPTLAGMAALTAKPRGQHAVHLMPQPRPERLPLSFAQQRLWFLEQLDRDSAEYNITTAIEFLGPLQVDWLHQGLEQIVARHEILRSRMHEQGEGAELIIDTDATLLLPVEEIEADDEGWTRLASQAADQEARRPFDLARDRLIRARILHRRSHPQAVLLLSLHHAVADDWSLQLLLDELARCYQDYATGATPQRPPLPVQYVDYSLWQRQPAQTGHYQRQLGYWQQTLEDGDYVLELPTDRPRQAEPDDTAGTEVLQLSPALSQRLRECARQHDVTPFMVLLATTQILLGRLANQRDVRIGTAVANRGLLETQTLIGCFVNTLVIRAELEPQHSFVDLLAQVKQRVVAAQEHQDVPFEQVVDALVSERDLTRSPLFQVMLTMQRASLHTADWPELALREIPSNPATAQFDLDWDIHDDGQQFSLQLTYRRALFDATTIHRWLDLWQRLLDQALSGDPGLCLAELDLVAPGERHLLLTEWNQTGQDFPLDKTYAQHFAERVAAHPQRIAAVCVNETLTYGELDTRASRLAAALIKAGAKPDTLVALLAERDLALLTMMIAVFKAGSAYLPLDVNHPPQRLRHLLKQSQAPILLVSNKTDSTFALLDEMLTGLENAPQVLVTESLWLQGAVPDLPLLGKPDDLAYVIFTSGSTGTPKGAMIEQRGMLNNIFGKVPTLGLSESDRIAQTASPAFDISVWQFLAAPILGATVHILPDEIARDPARLLQALESERLSVLEAVPTVIRGLLDAADEATALNALRWLLPTGEALPPDLCQAWFARFPHIPLMNAYGPAECADDVAFHAITEAPEATSAAMPIGRPTANNQLFILNDELCLVPIGVPGEICVAGVGVGRGYLNDPEKTRAAFVEHPFQPGQRFYRTGDLGRYRADGVIEFLGRRDHQVKVRGHRIELGEIEARLLALDAVADGAVIARRDQRGENQLAAYWVANSNYFNNRQNHCNNGQNHEHHPRDVLSAQLPHYMVPAAFVRLETLPVNANGKIDRKALAQRALTGHKDARAIVAPRTDNERILCELLCGLLKLEPSAGLNKKPISVTDNFFALGGDSILGLQLIARAKAQGVALTPKQLFQQRTIADLALAASQTLHIEAEQGRLQGEVPLLPIQHWLFEQNLANMAHWNQSLLLTPRERLNPAPVRATLQYLIDYHDALRLRFTQKDSGWHQGYGDDSVLLTFESIQLTPGETLKERLQPYATGFDLAKGPLLRAVLVALPDGQQRLYIAIHHLVIDTVSWRILLEEFSKVYAQIAAGEAPSLPAKTSSYRQWAKQLYRYAGSAALAVQLDYWSHQGGDRPLPVDHPEAPKLLSDEVCLIEKLSPQETDQLLHAAQTAYRTQVPELLLTALVQTLGEWKGDNALTVELEGHGREAAFLTSNGPELDLSRTVGWFTSLYPVCLRLPADKDTGNCIKAIKEQLRAVPEHGLGYGVLKYVTRTPLPDLFKPVEDSPHGVLFNYLGRFDSSQDEGLLTIADDPVPADKDGANGHTQELEIVPMVIVDQLQVEWRFSRRRYDLDTQERLLARYMECLRTVLRHCLDPAAGGLTPSDFPLARQLNQKSLDKLLGKLKPPQPTTTEH